MDNIPVNFMENNVSCKYSFIFGRDCRSPELKKIFLCPGSRVAQEPQLFKRIRVEIKTGTPQKGQIPERAWYFPTSILPI
jgi:hypothetical protein